MSERHDDWDPADGPPPTDDERADAALLADAVSGVPVARSRGAEPEFDALVATALRVKATAHPDRVKSAAVARAAVEHAVTYASQKWYRTRWPWLAAAAVLVLGIGGGQLAMTGRGADDASMAISRNGSDVFDTALSGDPQSQPIARLTDTRMRAYRDGLFHARTAQPRPR